MSHKNKIIGGEPEISSDLSEKVNWGKYIIPGSFFSSGRSALYAILNDIKKRGVTDIWLPDYLCKSIIGVINKSGLKYHFYDLDGELKPVFKGSNFNSVDQSVLVINYFGCQNLRPTFEELKLKNPNLIIIGDYVQAFYEYMNAETDVADYSFTSVRKWFPVPDGGFAFSKGGLFQEPEKQNEFWQFKYAGLILKGLRDKSEIKDEVYLELLKKGEEEIDNYLETRGSNKALSILSNLPFDKIAKIRRKNAEIILQGLKDLNIAPILTPAKNSIPFFIPIRIRNREKVRKKLFENNIFCPVHWPIENLKLKTGEILEREELSIVIDQRYNTDDMMRILEIISTNIG